MKRLSKEEIAMAMDTLDIPSIVALVDDMCAYTAEQDPSKREGAAIAAQRFTDWIKTAPPSWFFGNKALTGKEWMGSAVKAGFKPFPSGGGVATEAAK